MKLGLILGAGAYLWALALDLVPPSSVNIPVPLVFVLFPACILMPTVDPSFATVAILLAPMNAFVYGLLGLFVAPVETIAGVKSRFHSKRRTGVVRGLSLV